MIVVPNACPPGFETHHYARRFRMERSPADVWAWLEDPATFVDGQVWPYRVEFVSIDENPPGFFEGGLSVHHGPFLHLPGQLTEIRDGVYRDLRYGYASYVISPRLIRPTRLQFTLEPVGEGHATEVLLELDSYVRRGLARLWTGAQRLFWRRFPGFMRSGIERRSAGR